MILTTGLAQGGNGLLFPVCQTTTYPPKEQYKYIGCFVDGEGGSGGDDGGTGVRDVNGVTQQINGNTFDDGSQVRYHYNPYLSLCFTMRGTGYSTCEVGR